MKDGSPSQATDFGRRGQRIFCADPLGDILAVCPPATPPGPPNEKPQPAFRFWAGPSHKQVLAHLVVRPLVGAGLPILASGSQS